MHVVNACTVCTRLDPEADLAEEDDGFLRGRCEAFPDGIPPDIWDGSHGHRVAFGNEDLLWDGIEEDHEQYVDLFEILHGETPDGLA